MNEPADTTPDLDDAEIDTPATSADLEAAAEGLTTEELVALVY